MGLLGGGIARDRVDTTGRNPYTTNLVLCAVCDEMTGTMTRDLSGHDNRGELWGASTWGAGPRGAGVIVNTGGSGGVYNIWRVPKSPALSFLTADPFTFGTVWTAFALHDGLPLVCRNAANPFIMWRAESSTALSVVVSSSSDKSARVAFTYQALRTYACIASWDGSTLRAAVNGVYGTHSPRLASVELTSGTYWATRNQESIWNGVNARPFNGIIHRQMIWRRALSAAELIAWSANPDLPLWRPRRGIATVGLGGLDLIVAARRPPMIYRSGPRMILGGVI